MTLNNDFEAPLPSGWKKDLLSSEFAKNDLLAKNMVDKGLVPTSSDGIVIQILWMSYRIKFLENSFLKIVPKIEYDKLYSRNRGNNIYNE